MWTYAWRRYGVLPPGAPGHRHPDALAVDIIAAYDERVYAPYTGIYYENLLDISVDHIVAKTEVHDSGGCAWGRTQRRTFAPETWTVERMKLGEESGWQVVSAHEPDLGGFGVVRQMAVFCTATYASVDFSFISGCASTARRSRSSGRFQATSRR